MKLNEIQVKNFRLLEDVKLCLEDGVTLVVGRNNSGKTSLTELFRRLLDDQAPKFRLEDFSTGVIEQFWSAFQLHKEESDEAVIRKAIPIISTVLMVEYGKNEELGPLAPFVIDLNEECTCTQINIRYSLAEGKIDQFFEELEDDRPAFFKALKERIPALFKISVEARDPNDPTNRKPLEPSNLRVLLQFGFINAQRALDDVSYGDKAVLGKIFEKLFLAASEKTAQANDQATANTLKSAVDKAQTQIDEDFNKQLKQLIPTFAFFGYPGLTDPEFRTETILKVERLLSNNTTVGYLGVEGVNLPESYNGLGPRNLIYILLKLYEFFKNFVSQETASGVHLIFVEEPEAHLHPQMQSVFIRRLESIRELFAKEYNNREPWPVQFIVTTHSSHIANEASFNSMRYFLTQCRQQGSTLLKTEVKDLRVGLSAEERTNREFLHKYMTLTRCDLLFADRAILIEGTSERLLLPEMILKHDEAAGNSGMALRSQYLSIMEVGGAYAHVFFNLLDFLNLRTLVITDIDTVDKEIKGSKCRVSQGTHSSNACINSWFASDGKNRPTKVELLQKGEDEKIKQNRRIAFQRPHKEGDACGRSFEDAFLLANAEKFKIAGGTSDEREEKAWKYAIDINKTTFALEHAMEDTNWETPHYIEEGLSWLAGNSTSTTNPAVETATKPKGSEEMANG